ncbi:ABC transporter permease [Lichenifustis flavocetrariae]|uniref:ABC transporter permease n=1 Tax=Lichenifustis flavocetrariae TaxID=2949735 RepID=A0AA41YYG0_9HYPH|nr:ABC transporter permease [Lichenifustis flavocetrariae]MCW6510896.1 ABC transporter permease [Lichenifustis flavocetrariae]
MSLLPTRRDWTLAGRDLTRGFAAWNIWFLLGVSDIRQRYKRSRFGQFWITLSMGIFIGGIGVVYSALFNQPVAQYIPHVAVNMTVWTLISGVVGDAANVFTQSAMYMRQDALPKTIFIMRLIIRNIVVFAHNVVIVPLAFIIFGIIPTPLVFAAIPGLIIVILALFLITLILGVLSTRFRDLAQITQNALQLLFFITPIMWRSDQLSAGRQIIVVLNPFASLLQLVADPLLGIEPQPHTYIASFTFIAFLLVLALPLFARFRARLVYWL